MRQSRLHEEACKRLARALVAAEAGDGGAWRLLDLGALERLRVEGAHLAALVPHALIRLTDQLSVHPRAGVRYDLVALLRALYLVGVDDVGGQLARLAQDGSPRVQRTARQALRDLGVDAGASARATSPSTLAVRSARTL